MTVGNSLICCGLLEIYTPLSSLLAITKARLLGILQSAPSQVSSTSGSVHCSYVEFYSPLCPTVLHTPIVEQTLTERYSTNYQGICYLCICVLLICCVLPSWCPSYAHIIVILGYI